MNEKEPSHLSSDEIEEIEELTLRWIFQAILDFGMEAHDIFLNSPDSVKDIAEDITRELLDRLPGFNVQQTWNRYKLAAHFGCSEQTIDRRLNGDNIRGGKYQTQTRVFLVSGLIEEAANEAGFYLYDRRVWVKDAAWENSRWHTISYRSVDEFEYIYIFWKPGTIDVLPKLKHWDSYPLL